MRAPSRVLVSVAALLAPAALRASCGSASCPIDTYAFNVPDPGKWSLDVSFQYIDQDEPRIGTDSAEVGEIPSEHDEVRTLNRAAALTLRYAPADRFQVGVTVPWISRFHEHLAGEEEHGHEAEEHGHQEALAKHDGDDHEARPERWSLEGLGDLALDVQFGAWRRGRASLWLLAAIELPTGDSDLDNDDGEIAELPIQPGSDSIDAIVGATLRGSLVRETSRVGVLGRTSAVPYFVSATYRRNGDGRDDYRLGAEWQLNAGGAYPLGRAWEALLQLNGRYREKDSPGNTEEDTELTGGTFIYLSPGLRRSVGERWAGYAYVQVPVYQDVNQLQLVSEANWLVGAQARF